MYHIYPTLLNTFSLTQLTAFIGYSYISIVLYKIVSVSFLWHKHKNMYAKNYIKPNVHFKLFTAVKAAEMGISKRVQIWCSNALNVPITFGYFNNNIFSFR